MQQTFALSVGEPVKNLETSELNEFVALIPMTMSTTPPTSRARETILFIAAFKEFVRPSFQPVTPACARK